MMGQLVRLAYPLLWLAEALTPPSGTTSVPPADSNPISAAYSWAQLLALLTDRALWLFFLGIILSLAWYVDRRKEKKLAEQEKELREIFDWQKGEIEHLAVTLHDNSECMTEVKHVLERIERKL